MSKPSRSEISIGDIIGPLHCKCGERLFDFYAKTIIVRCPKCKTDNKICITTTKKGNFKIPTNIKYEIVEKSI